MREKRHNGRSTTKTSIEDEIAHLRGLDLTGLRARWQSVFQRPPPDHLLRHLLFAIVAYRVQADRFGDLDHETTIGHGQRTVWRHDEHVDERRNANNQEAEQNGGNESSGSPPPRCPTLKHWEIALSCHSCGVRLEAHRGLSLAPCLGFDNYLLAYSGRTLVGLRSCFFRRPPAPRQFPRSVGGHRDE